MRRSARYLSREAIARLASGSICTCCARSVFAAAKASSSSKSQTPPGSNRPAVIARFANVWPNRHSGRMRPSCDSAARSSNRVCSDDFIASTLDLQRWQAVDRCAVSSQLPLQLQKISAVAPRSWQVQRRRIDLQELAVAHPRILARPASIRECKPVAKRPRNLDELRRLRFSAA